MMIREWTITGREQPISLRIEEVGIEFPRGDHHQQIDDGEPVVPACSSDGTEGTSLGFRGAEEPIAAVADDYASGCPTGLCPNNDWVGREAGGLNPTCCDDGVTD